VGWDGLVGIVAQDGLDCLGMEFSWGKIFRARQDRSWGSPRLLYSGYRVIPGGKAAGTCH